MPGSPYPGALPNLSPDNHRVTSPRTDRYNCIAWAAGDDGNWWWPVGNVKWRWPPGVPREETVAAFVAAFATLGYAPCRDGAPEAGYEKVALFARNDGNGVPVPTHAARQLPDGRWTSKLGKMEDIDHDTVAGVSGPAYGEPVRFLRRARNAP